MTKKMLDEWYRLLKQKKADGFKYDYDYQTLVSLNYDVMELSHDIHNNNMMRDWGMK